MEKAVNKFARLFVSACTLLLAYTAGAQTGSIPALERKVTVTLDSVDVEQALKKLGSAAGCTFSYKSDVLDKSQRASGKYVNQPVRAVLDELFEGKVSYRAKENYIILKRLAPSASEATIEGYVTDAATGDKVPNASIYDRTTMASAISDGFGYYSIRTDERPQINLTINKENYRDTIIYVSSATGTKVNIAIYPLPKPEIPRVAMSDSMHIEERFKLPYFIFGESSKTNLRNLQGRIQKQVQFSFVPYAGTNSRLSGNARVNYSFNLLGGFNYGVRIFEVGAFANINWDSVSYCQLAGFMNLTGGPQQGFQAAGFLNMNHSSVKGVQCAGFTNIIESDLIGAQFAGFSNVLFGEGSGAQVSGFCNVAIHRLHGLQFAGFLNTARTSSTVIQGAGFVNICAAESQVMQFSGFINGVGHHSKGLQISGFGNFTASGSQLIQVAGLLNGTGDDAKGVQIAGFMNYADNNYTGFQLSGFLNRAQNIKGMQIGLINVCDSIDGLQLGFFSFSRQGYHQLEVSGNETFPLNLSFRTGTHRFYNIFSAGVQFGASKPLWSYGYGVGTSFGLSPKSRLFLDLQSHQLQRDANYEFVHSLSKLSLSYEFRLSPKIALAAGPTFNVLVVSGLDDAESQAYLDVAPYHFYDHTSHGTNVKMWVGGQVAVRLF